LRCPDFGAIHGGKGWFARPSLVKETRHGRARDASSKTQSGSRAGGDEPVDARCAGASAGGDFYQDTPFKLPASGIYTFTVYANMMARSGVSC
jgi:hypothetical protein